MLSTIGVVFSVLALSLDIAGVVSPDWFHWSLTIQGLTVTIKFGLWKCCTDVPTLQSGCFGLEDIENPVSVNIQASRGLEIISLLLVTVAGSLAVFQICVKKYNRHILQGAAAISFLAGIVTKVGAIVFVVGNTVKKYLDENALKRRIIMKPHTGFALCITSGILSLVAALLYFIDSRLRKNTVRSDGC